MLDDCRCVDGVVAPERVRPETDLEDIEALLRKIVCLLRKILCAIEEDSVLRKD